METAMCEECEFGKSCCVLARVCRDILRSGDFRGMWARTMERTKDCSLYVPKERRRYA
jgi:hypothetical protein